MQVNGPSSGFIGENMIGEKAELFSPVRETGSSRHQ
jgi:hypothetical protein